MCRLFVYKDLLNVGRAQWSCGLIPYVLDQEIEGLNQAAANFHQFFSAKE